MRAWLSMKGQQETAGCDMDMRKKTRRELQTTCPTKASLLQCSSDRPGWATHRTLYIPPDYVNAASTTEV